MKHEDTSVESGIVTKDRKEVAKGLSKLLADSYLSYLKTQNYHWNVVGPQFTSLHLLFEKQYTELAGAVDDIAERIRALGEPAPGTFSKFSNISSIHEDQEIPSATAMIKNLVHDNDSISKFSRELTHIAEQADDDATCDLLTKRMESHEKNAWMLRSLLE